jgi:PAS domain S-box-containing protein
MFNLRKSLAAKWLILQIVGLGLVLCLAGLYQYRSIRDAAYKEVKDAGDSVSQTIRERIAENPELFNTESLQPVFFRLTKKVANIRHITVIDQGRQIIVDSENDNLSVADEIGADILNELLQESGSTSSFYQTDEVNFLRLSYSIEGRYDPIRKNNIVGILTLDMDLSNPEKNISAAFTQTMLILTGLLFLFWIVQYILARRGFLYWLRHLTQAAESFGNGNFSARASVKTKDELGRLAGSFNRMAAEVEQSDAALKSEIAERRRAEELLSLLAAIVESSDDAILSKNLDGVILSWNAGAAKLYGYAATEAVGQNAAMLTAPDRPDEESRLLERVRRGENMKHYETVRLRKNGEIINVSLSVSPIKDSNGAITGASTIARDITEQKRIAAELKRAHDVALESARLKSEFLANMSHEIRTPMNGVIGMTGLLLDTELDEEQREFTETVRSSADSLLTIINDILDFSKIEAGKLHFERLDFDLRHTVESTVELLAERAQSKKIELLSLVDSDVLTLVNGDAGRIKQVLLNLVGNAVKFTERGEVTVCATKESESETHITVRFAVRDTGIGISEEEQRRLFQAFVQADGSTTRKYGGTGLGLAISKQIVEMMGGEIGIESASGKGSTFWFVVKLKKQSAAAVVAAAPAPRRDLNGLRVLIVDDNATNRKILRHQTASWGMIPVEAESGSDALEMLGASVQSGEPFDVALLDLMMPGMDGFELARAVKQNSQLSKRAAHSDAVVRQSRRRAGGAGNRHRGLSDETRPAIAAIRLSRHSDGRRRSRRFNHCNFKPTRYPSFSRRKQVCLPHAHFDCRR